MFGLIWDPNFLTLGLYSNNVKYEQNEYLILLNEKKKMEQFTQQAE